MTRVEEHDRLAINASPFSGWNQAEVVTHCGVEPVLTEISREIDVVLSTAGSAKVVPLQYRGIVEQTYHWRLFTFALQLTVRLNQRPKAREAPPIVPGRYAPENGHQEIHATDTHREPNAFTLQISDSNVAKAYKMALTVVEGNIKLWQRGLLDTAKPVLIAGKGYTSPWTRDASYNTFFCAGLIYPEVAKNTLLSVLVREKNIIRIGGQYWDCIAWVTGAWAYYVYTGDEDFLDTAYSVSINSLAYFREREFDRATGLFCGPGWSDGIGGYPEPYNQTGGSSFILDYSKHNAHIDKIRMKALSTNCLYYNALRKAARMGELLGRPAGELTDLTKKADALRTAINQHLWIDCAGHYAYFLDVDGQQDPSLEGLGHAQAILFGIADADHANRVFKNQYVSPYGIPLSNAAMAYSVPATVA